MVRKIRTAAVIGSGVMGGGIAALLAGAGVKTLLLDIVPFDLKDDEKDNPIARNRIAQAGLDTVKMSRPSLLMQQKDADLISIGNLEDDFDKLADCDWIVEVVVENLKIKQELFKRIEPVRKAGSIISSNTSGIPLKAMSEGLSDEFRQHFLGTHFFTPVRYMKLLEIIPGEQTLPEILDFMADYGERVLGKGIVWAKDTPNFVGNRIGVQGIVKAMQLMLEDEMTIAEVDALFGPAMGRPKTAMFKTSDLVGLDTLGHVAANTYELVVDDEARESFKMPEFVTKMIEKGLLGKKSKSGFYKTDLTPEWIIETRNRIGTDQYSGITVENSYLTMAYTNYLGRPAIKTRGLWGDAEPVMGGPFTNYSFYDRTQKRLYMIDMFVYRPGRLKLPFLQPMEVLAHTFVTKEDMQ